MTQKNIQDHVMQPARYQSIEAEETILTPPSLPLRTKLLYGMGEISNSIKTLTFGLFLLFYYTSVLGLPGTLVGIATTISLVWDALIDPFIGYLSDKARFRFGKRHTFMLVGAVTMGVSFFAIFSPPQGLSMSALFVWLLVTNILLRTANSIFVVPYHALGAELSNEYHERTSITGIRAGLALLGTMIAASLSFVVFFPNEIPGVDPKFNVGGYGRMGLTLGLAITMVGLIATVGTLSKRSRHSANGTSPDAQTPAPSGKLGFFSGVMISLRNRTFLSLTLSSGVFFLASVINATLALHFLTYYAGITESRALSIFQFAFYLGGIGGVLTWLSISKKVDKHKLYLGATLVVSLVVASAYWLVGADGLFGTGNIVPLAIGNGIGGFFASALWVLPASMIADLADQDELTTGRRREGAYFGIHSFFHQEAGSIAILVTGFLIDHFAGLVPGQVDQSAQTVNRLGILFSLLPAILYLLSGLLILGYRLTPQRLNSIQQQLVQPLDAPVPAAIERRDTT